MHYDAVAFLDRLFRAPAGVSVEMDATVSPAPDIRVEDLDPEWRVEWEERTAIMQYDGGLHREHAEAEALTNIIEEMRQAGLFRG